MKFYEVKHNGSIYAVIRAQKTLTFFAQTGRRRRCRDRTERNENPLASDLRAGSDRKESQRDSRMTKVLAPAVWDGSMYLCSTYCSKVEPNDENRWYSFKPVSSVKWNRNANKSLRHWIELGTWTSGGVGFDQVRYTSGCLRMGCYGGKWLFACSHWRGVWGMEVAWWWIWMSTSLSRVYPLWGGWNEHFQYILGISHAWTEIADLVMGKDWYYALKLKILLKFGIV